MTLLSDLARFGWCAIDGVLFVAGVRLRAG